VVPQREAVVPTRVGVVQKREGVSLRREGVVPKRGGVVSKREGVVPKQGGVSLRREGVVPNRGGVVVKRGGVVPKRGGVVPKRGGVVVKRGGVVPKRGGVVPKRGGVVVRRGGVVVRRGGGGDYITIEETTAGAAVVGTDPAVAAVYTVTVKTALPAGKVVTFTNVADDDVVYKPATTDNTKAKQAAAIAALFGDGSGTPPDGAIYDVAYTASAESFTLTQPEGSEGPVAEADRTAVTATDAPKDVTGSLTTVAADDGKYVKLVVEGGDFAPGAAVYYKKDGTEILITSGTTAVILCAANDSAGTALAGAGGAFDTSAAAGKITVSAWADVKVHPGNTSANRLFKITGGAAAGTISGYGGSGGSGFVTINAAIATGA
jgi:hypothetical protein